MPSSSSTPFQVVWFKRDLRVSDHAPLAEAAARGPVLPVYLIEDEVIRGKDFDARHWGFIRESLQKLSTRLGELGAPLQVRKGEAVASFQRLREQYPLAALWSHEETGNAVTFRRDRRVARWAREVGLPWHELPNNGVVRGLKDRDKWHGVWEKRMRAAPIPLPDVLNGGGLPPTRQIPSAEQLRLSSICDGDFQSGGEPRAHETLESFFASRGARYTKEMSSPLTAEMACSRLSPYLAYGCLSLRQAVQAARGALEHIREYGTSPSGEAFQAGSVRSFLSRCHWHDHFIQKLEREPRIEHACFHRGFEGMREPEWSAERYGAWLNGQTGYPFVDACLRMLRATGWINFRMRAMLTSFAAYDLWLDWRGFKDDYARLFTDYEPGIHFSQCQMQSGVTGINTLRIYSPVKQGYDQDPQGDFVRRWVPELAGIAGAEVHEPWKLTGRAQTEAERYAKPIVDHAAAVKYARAQFAEVRRREGFRAESQRVYQEHGSRRNRENRGFNRTRRQQRDEGQGELAFG